MLAFSIFERLLGEFWDAKAQCDDVEHRNRDQNVERDAPRRNMCYGSGNEGPKRQRDTFHPSGHSLKRRPMLKSGRS